MVTKSTKVFFLSLTCFIGTMPFLPSIVLASPSINGVSGTITNGQNITISGSSFGTKTNAAPIKFDNFNNGTSGAKLNSKDSSWNIYDGPGDGQGLLYQTAQSHSGGGSVGRNSTNGEMFNTNYYTFSPATEVFISYWYYISSPSGCGATIIKLPRITSTTAAGGGAGGATGGTYNGLGNTSFGGTYDACAGSAPYLAYIKDPSATEQVVGYFDSMPSNGSWHRVDMYKKLSSPGVANGSVFVKVYGLQEMNALGNQMTVAAGQSFTLNNVWMGIGDGSDSNHNYNFYIDDFYIDRTQARVEVCDTSTWSARTQCEIQPATAWSASSIAFTVNQGAIPNNSSRYLYVVDSGGLVNSNGYSLTFGASSKTPLPAPTGLLIK